MDLYVLFKLYLYYTSCRIISLTQKGIHRRQYLTRVEIVGRCGNPLIHRNKSEQHLNHKSDELGSNSRSKSGSRANHRLGSRPTALKLPLMTQNACTVLVVVEPSPVLPSRKLPILIPPLRCSSCISLSIRLYSV